MISSLSGIAGSFVASRLVSGFSTQKVNVVYAMPGRIRIQSNQWKSKEVSQSFLSAFKNHPLVHQVSASSITGTLLLEFNVPYLTTKQLDQLVQQAVDVSVSTYPRKEANIMKAMKKVTNRVDSTIKAKTMGNADLNSILILLLLGKGIGNFNRNPSFAIGLLLWAYGLLTREVGNDD
jgi:hypothetical protein